MDEQSWEVLVFRDERGREPVTDFILGLQREMQAKVLRNIDVLQERGPSVGMPLSRPIPGYQLLELRSQAGGNISRILYFAAPGRKLILLHGFVKKTQATPKRELRIAAERREKYVRDNR